MDEPRDAHPCDPKPNSESEFAKLCWATCSSTRELHCSKFAKLCWASCSSTRELHCSTDGTGRSCLAENFHGYYGRDRHDGYGRHARHVSPRCSAARQHASHDGDADAKHAGELPGNAVYAELAECISQSPTGHAEHDEKYTGEAKYWVAGFDVVTIRARETTEQCPNIIAFKGNGMGPSER